MTQSKMKFYFHFIFQTSKACSKLCFTFVKRCRGVCMDSCESNWKKKNPQLGPEVFGRPRLTSWIRTLSPNSSETACRWTVDSARWSFGKINTEDQETLYDGGKHKRPVDSKSISFIWKKGKWGKWKNYISNALLQFISNRNMEALLLIFKMTQPSLIYLGFDIKEWTLKIK